MNVDFKRACSILREGHALVFPTDTVVGIGVAVAYASGLDEVFAAKRRPVDKPVAWLVGSAGALDEWGHDVPGYARQLAEALWPGAVTLVVPAAPGAGWDWGTAEQVPNSRPPTIGLRMPASQLVCDLIEAAGSPLAATSANLSGCPAPATVAELDPEFACDLPVLDAPACSPVGSVASTVIDCTGSTPRVLRAGTISASDIEEVLAHANQHC